MNQQLLPRWCKLAQYCVQTDAAKYSVSIGLGIVFGIILNVSQADADFTSLITLPGPLFIRALQCAVVPMMYLISFFIFCLISFIGFLILPHQYHKYMVKDE